MQKDGTLKHLWSNQALSLQQTCSCDYLFVFMHFKSLIMIGETFFHCDVNKVFCIQSNILPERPNDKNLESTLHHAETLLFI